MKHPFILTRRRASNQHTYGLLETTLPDGRSMKLLTKEGKHLRLGNPVNPAFHYCLPEGRYLFTWKPVGMWPYVPVLRTRAPQPKSRFADDDELPGSGNICIGTKLDGMDRLVGFNEAMGIIDKLFKDCYDDWRDNPELIIRCQIDFDRLLKEKEQAMRINYDDEECETIIEE